MIRSHDFADWIWGVSKVCATFPQKRVIFWPRLEPIFESFLFCWKFVFKPKKLGAARAMGKRAGNTNTGEGVKGNKVRSTSNDAGGKSLSKGV